METVTIERSALEWLTREAIEMRSYDSLEIAHECDRLAVIHVHKAIEALDMSEEFQAEAIVAREKCTLSTWRTWHAERLSKRQN